MALSRNMYAPSVHVVRRPRSAAHDGQGQPSFPDNRGVLGLVINPRVDVAMTRFPSFSNDPGCGAATGHESDQYEASEAQIAHDRVSLFSLENSLGLLADDRAAFLEGSSGSRYSVRLRYLDSLSPYVPMSSV